MGDPVSWTALGVLLPVVLCLFAVAVAWGRLSAKVNNGLTSDVREIKEGQVRIWQRLDQIVDTIGGVKEK